MDPNQTDILTFEDKLDIHDDTLSELNFINDEIYCSSAYQRVLTLKKILKNNILGCDLMICLFIAALKSYKADCVLRPFPPYFLKNDEDKDFDLLKYTCDNIPPVKNFISLPNSNSSKDVTYLLSWLFVEKRFPILKPCNISELPVLSSKVIPVPHYVFKVCYNRKNEDTWQTRIKDKEIFYAFHGSAVANFYSILKSGLQQHFSNGKEVLFGEGIYLSDELSICTNYAPFSKIWKNSNLGNKHSIIAVCEVLNDTEKVKCKDAKNKLRSLQPNSVGEIPEKYFVVTDSEIVKVKYLLVYRYKSKYIRSFLLKHLFWIVILIYFLMLVLIGFFNSPNWYRLVKYVLE